LLHNEILLFEINEYLKENNFFLINNDILVGLNDIIWNTNYIEMKFNFIDIIKGFMPFLFLQKIDEIMHNRKITKLIIYKYRQKFVFNINFYWKRCCKLTKELDQKLGIVKKTLKENKGVDKI
jgi:hypothetical protein